MNPTDVVGGVEQILGLLAVEKIDLPTAVGCLRELVSKNEDLARSAVQPFVPAVVGSALGAAIALKNLARTLEAFPAQMGPSVAAEMLLNIKEAEMV